MWSPYRQEETTTAHIALDIRVTQGGYPGIGRATAGLAASLLSAPTRHRFALLYRADLAIPDQILRALRTPHHAVALRAPLRSPLDQIELPWRLRENKIDLYHAPYYATALRPGVPYVVTVHDTIPSLFPEYWSKTQGVVIRAWQRQSISHAGCVITGSEAAANDVHRIFKFDRARIVVTPWGTVEWNTPALTLTGPIDEPYLLCVCTNKPHKNLLRLVQAYHEASITLGSCPNLVIAGGWSGRFPEAEREASRLASLNHSAGSIRFVHDPTDGQLRYLYEHALGFVFPSIYEGFGLPILEAMQAGLPIAASSAPAVAEVAGKAALMFDPMDVRSMSCAIQQLSEDRDGRARLAQAARERIKVFSWQWAADGTLRAYEVAICG